MIFFSSPIERPLFFCKRTSTGTSGLSYAVRLDFPLSRQKYGTEKVGSAARVLMVPGMFERELTTSAFLEGSINPFSRRLV